MDHLPHKETILSIQGDIGRHSFLVHVESTKKNGRYYAFAKGSSLEKTEGFLIYHKSGDVYVLNGFPKYTSFKWKENFLSKKKIGTIPGSLQGTASRLIDGELEEIGAVSVFSFLDISKIVTYYR